MKVFLNKKSITLSSSDYIASGGQASIYKKNNLAFKIYSDPSFSIPIGKIRELSVLNLPEIISPKNILKDSRSKEIGYVMPYIKDRLPICKLFVRSFLKQLNFSNQELLGLILKSRETIDYIHNQGILVVDLNEMNLLLDKKTPSILFIDTDSYQTKSYPATFIAENIRDWSVGTNWNKNSDWFSWGIITYQIFTGIHPFGGNHKGYNKNKDRMINNISVYNPEVKYPKVFKNKDLMPQIFDDWYKAVFENGSREEPPKSAVASTKIQIFRPTLSSRNLEVIEICSLPSDILEVRHSETNQIILSTKEKEYSKIGNQISDNKIEVNSFYYKGTKYKREKDSIFKEIVFRNIKTRKLITKCMPNSTQLFDGLVIQEAADTYILNIFPTDKTIYTIFIKDLNKHRILDAKFGSKLILLSTTKNGEYYHILYSLDENYKISNKREIKNKSFINISFAVLDNGTCVRILEEEKLELFSEKYLNKIQIIEDTLISTTMSLFSDFNVIYFSQGNRFYKLRTK